MYTFIFRFLVTTWLFVSAYYYHLIIMTSQCVATLGPSVVLLVHIDRYTACRCNCAAGVCNQADETPHTHTHTPVAQRYIRFLLCFYRARGGVVSHEHFSCFARRRACLLLHTTIQSYVRTSNFVRGCDEVYSGRQSNLCMPVAPVAYQVILECGIG